MDPNNNVIKRCGVYTFSCLTRESLFCDTIKIVLKFYMWGKIRTGNILRCIFLFFPENWILYFMQIVLFSGNKNKINFINLSSTEFAHSMQSFNETISV